MQKPLTDDVVDVELMQATVIFSLIKRRSRFWRVGQIKKDSLDESRGTLRRAENADTKRTILAPFPISLIGDCVIGTHI